MSRYPAKARKAESSPFINGDAVALYNHYRSRLAGVAATRYRWEGLPDSIDPMGLEMTLILDGGLAAWTHLRRSAPLQDGQYEASNGRFRVSRCFVAGPIDDLFMPAGYTAYGPGAPSITFKTDKPVEEWAGVPIWGDSLRQNYDGATIDLFAKRMAQASLIVDTNMKATTRGMVAITGQDELLSTQATVDAALSGITVFTGKEDVIDRVKAFDFGVHPDTVERSHVVAMRLWNEALTALGVQAGAQEKEERLTDDEVQAIRGAVAAVRRRTLEPRQLAARRINRRYFGGNEIVRVVDQW